MMKKRILFLSTLTVMVFALAAMADPGRGMRAGQRGPGGPGFGQQWIAEALDLSEAQLAQWNAIRETTHAQMVPLATERRANRDAIEAELESAAPNAQRIGELVLANYALRDQAQAIRENAQAQFVALLTPEQKEKYDEFLELMKNRPRRGRGPGGGDGPGAGFGFGPGGGFGPGFGDCPFGED